MKLFIENQPVNNKEAIDLISAAVNMNIRHIENHISSDSMEEDIEFHEKRIMSLQHEWQEKRQSMTTNGQNSKLYSQIELN